MMRQVNLGYEEKALGGKVWDKKIYRRGKYVRTRRKHMWKMRKRII